MTGEVHGRPCARGTPGAVGEFVVVMADPVTGAVDAFGPFAAAAVAGEIQRRRAELSAEGLDEVVVVAVALNSAP